jgi:Flp pilus assembly protein TadG
MRVGNSRRRKARRGSALVEFALIGLMFFILLIGIADMGQMLFLQQALAERARGAARWGAVTDPTNTSAIRNMVLYLQPTVPGAARTSFGLTPAMVSVTTPDAGTDNYRLVVRVSGYSYILLSPSFAGSYQGVPVSVSVPLGLYH